VRPPELLVAPTGDVVTLEEVKSFCRVDHADDDDMLTPLIKESTSKLDGYSGSLGRALLTQTWKVWGGYSANPFRIPLAPVQSVIVRYIDASGDYTDAGAATYRQSADAISDFVTPRMGYYWPALLTEPDAVEVEFVAGYGEAADVPADIRRAIKLDVKIAFDRPEGPAYEALRDEYDAIINRYWRRRI
jgi:uncharacterized phiE125 gp8 family phage protein